MTSTYLRITENASSLDTSFETTLRAAPLSFVRSGRYNYDTSTLYRRGGYGSYWSSRANGTTSAYYLTFTSTYIYPQVSNSKGNGFALRCVAR